MADAIKHISTGGNLVSDLKMFSVLRTRRSKAFAYGFMFAFVAFTVFLAFSPSSNSSSPWKDYYQEGSHVYGDLNVVEAFRKALTTWARWVVANINPKTTLVFFRGYSVSHFSGGRWNFGGQCDSETDPIKNKTDLSAYPPKMRV